MFWRTSSLHSRERRQCCHIASRRRFIDTRSQQDLWWKYSGAKSDREADEAYRSSAELTVPRALSRWKYWQP
jgi:hypothetical protein